MSYERTMTSSQKRNKAMVSQRTFASSGHQSLLGRAAAGVAVLAATTLASTAAVGGTLAARATLAFRSTLTSRTCSSQQHIPVTNSSITIYLEATEAAH